MWDVECGMWNVECGCGVWNVDVECGCGTWNRLVPTTTTTTTTITGKPARACRNQHLNVLLVSCFVLRVSVFLVLATCSCDVERARHLIWTLDFGWLAGWLAEKGSH